MSTTNKDAKSLATCILVQYGTRMYVIAGERLNFYVEKVKPSFIVIRTEMRSK
jgi:hypothetical protein